MVAEARMEIVHGAEGAVTYTGVLTARGLAGIAQFANEALGALSRGSWSLTDSARTGGRGGAHALPRQ